MSSTASPNQMDPGQWIGSTLDEKGNVVLITLNIEKRTPDIAQILSYNPAVSVHRSCTTARPEVQGDTVLIQSPDTKFFDNDSFNLITSEQFLAKHKLDFPPVLWIKYQIKSRAPAFTGTFENNKGERGTFSLVNSATKRASPPTATLSWTDFKAFVSKNYLDNDLILFRGHHTNRYRLQTSLHRLGRNDLLRYLNEDVPRLRHSVNGLSQFYYEASHPEHLGALLSVARHHGFPTPLLDWSLSPYIAAFFAFNDVDSSKPSPEAVRIFVFNLNGWPTRPSPIIIYDPLPMMSFHQFSAHSNPRSIPQQSVISFTNIDDIEDFVSGQEKTSGLSHLTTIDIPIADRRTALSELRLMGITRAALFPGLDGLCKELKDHYFAD